MDPYLEPFWGDVHAAFIVYAADELQEQLPPGLFARIDERPAPRTARGAIRHIRILDHSVVSAQRSDVSVIEFLAPADKTLRRGHEDYDAEVQRWRNAGANLVEIDLLRAGDAGWFRTPRHVQLPASDFLISIQPAGKHQFEVYPTSLRERLPTIHVPLRPDDSDVMLDLQKLINRCYQHGRYEAVIDYNREPDPPLGEDDAAWADELLRAAGMRQ